jgi:hypothetical protein
MKIYGDFWDIIADDYATNESGWSGRQSRKVARRRRDDKRLLHRKQRRVDKYKLESQKHV